MIIDRHNYEEMFILYWDNELDAAQKRAVEEFVAANSDLQGEFSILGSSRFTPEENITFPAKALLFQNDSLIDQSNYEEYLLSYVDGEVNQKERVEIEQFIKSNPGLQTELVLLQSTKLHPDQHIVFPDKSILYRREEKTFRIIWLRVAAAAVVLLIAGVYTFNLFNGSNADEVNPEFAVVQPKKPVEATQQNQKETSSNEKDEATARVNDQIVGRNDSEEVKEKKINMDEGEKNRDLFASNKIIETDVEETTTNTNIETDVVINRLPNEAVEGFKNVSDRENDPNKSLIDQAVTVRTSPSLNDIETHESDKDGGGGVKGLLRKATRVFERRTNIKATTDDDKLLVGAFAVSLK